MKKKILSLVVFCGLAALVITVSAQPPDGGDKGPKKGPPEGGKKGPPRFELGKVLPPFVRDQLDLTEAQEKQIGDLEKEVKTKLMNILTADQKQRIQEMAKKGPKGPPDDDDKGPKEGKKGKKGDKGPKDGGGKGPKDGGDKGPKNDVFFGHGHEESGEGRGNR